MYLDVYLAIFPVRLTINLAAVVFALALFLLSIFSWSRRRRPTLLMFAGAFFAFLVEELLELTITSDTFVSDYVTPTLTLAALILFFVGLLIGSGSDLRKKRGPKP